MDVNLHVYLHGDPSVDDRLKRIEHMLVKVIKQGETIMATTAEVAALAQAVLDAVTPLGPAIDGLEAQITALKNSGALTPQQQADLDAAFAALTSAHDGITAKVADATDGIDEAANP